jgi:hypothetical protein
MNEVNLLALKLIEDEICRRLEFKLQVLILFMPPPPQKKTPKEN